MIEVDWLSIANERIDALIDATEKKRDRKTLMKAYLIVEQGWKEKDAADLKDFRDRGDRFMRIDDPVPGEYAAS